MSGHERVEPQWSEKPIEPVRKERRLDITADEAFGLLTEGMGTELRNGYEPGWDIVLAPFEARAARYRIMST